MPELPDVETFRRKVAAATLHQTVRRIELASPEMVKDVSVAELRRQVEGKSIERTERIGKYLFLGLKDGGWLELHFGMSGHPEYVASGEPVPPYTRMALMLDRGRLAYVVPRKLGRISWVGSPEQLAEAKGLGIDALDPRLDFERFAALAERGGAVKCWLMDQTHLAGIGNVYSDEILFQARIHPKRNVREMERKELRHLYATLKKVLSEALAKDADPDRLPKDWLLPRRRAGQPCPGCAGTIRRLTLCGRSAYFCPGCQPERREPR